MSFTPLKPEDLAGKTAEELALYYNEKNEHQRALIQEQIEAKASKEDIESLRTELVEGRIKQMHQLNESLKGQGIAIKALMKQGVKAEPKNISDQVKAALEANKENLEGLKHKSSAQKSSFDFEVKAPATMTFANVSGGNIPVEDRLEGFNTIPSRQVRFLDVLSKRTTTSNVVSWVHQANKDGAAGTTGEGTAKNQIDFDLVVTSESIKKLTAYIKVSTEMLDDISWIQSEINSELMRELLKAVESQAYSGDGTGNNLNGVRTVATAFAAGTFANTVDNANEVDVLAVAINQIKIAEHDSPNYIFMHPSDVTALKLVKLSTSDKRYIDRLMLVGSTLRMDGIPIIETTLVTQGQYLVGDFGLSMLVTKEGIRIDIGLDADDFTKNLRTIIAEWRGLTLVKNNDRTAFVAGTFATDKTAINV